MSVLSTITVDVEKFLKGTGTDLEKFSDAFEAFLKKAPSALQAVDNFLSEVGAVTEVAVALIDPAEAAAVAAGLATVETAIGALGAAATAAVSGDSLLTDLQNFATQVPALLTGLSIKNSALQAAVTKIVTLVVNETKVLLPAVESWVAQLSAKSKS